MGTHNWNRKTYSLACVCVGILVTGNWTGMIIEIQGNISSSDAPQTLIDKVFTFSAPNDSLTFKDLAFIEEYIYYFTIEIVTPHNCAINITITDPNFYLYRIFETEVNISQDDGWFEIPFGTAITGNYSILVEIITPLTLNIHLRLVQEHKCLYDIIPPNLLGTLKFYEVSRYTDGMKLTHNVQLRTDYSYKFYIARVSSIGGLESDREVEIFFNLTDPELVLFQIYSNTTLVPIGNVLSLEFGTAIGGLYTFGLLIHCAVDCVNIAYAIAEDHRISDEINGTTPPDPLNNSTTPRGLVIMPLEFTIGMGSACVVLVLAAFIVVVRKQKKNSVRRTE